MRDVAAAAALVILVLVGAAIAMVGKWWQVWLIGFPLMYAGAYGIIELIDKHKSNGND